MKLADHVEQIRELIEGSFDKQFAQLGFGKVSQLDVDKLSNLPEDAKTKRERFVEMIETHTAETGSYEEGRAKLIDELTFTLFNRLAAIKVMESANLFAPILTKQVEHGNRSFGHKLWLEANPPMREANLEGIDDYIKYEFDKLGETLPLYSKSYPYSLLPDSISLNDIIDAFNAVEKDEQIIKEYAEGIWHSDDILGWLYESYNNQKKQAHKDSKEKTEYNKVSLQSQVYTPRWVVQFLVENSLGKMYLEMYPNSQIKDNHKIANVPTSSTRTPKPLHEIKIIDPACGSGNFLLYAFDFFYELYLDQIENYDADYEEKDIPKLIIENNLHGVDLDDRAIQLAQLGLFIKAKKKRSRIGEMHYNVVSSDFYLPEYDTVRHIFEQGNRLQADQQELIETIWGDLQYTYKFGSLIRIDEQIQERLRAVEEQAPYDLFGDADIREQRSFADTFFKNLTQAVEQYASSSKNTFLATQAQDAITFLEILTKKYDVATANPPYTDSSDFGPELKKFVNNNYKKPDNFSTNLYATFIKRCYELTNEEGLLALVHPQTFMYIKTFSDVRRFMLDESHLELFVEWGYLGMFHPSARVDSVMYILNKTSSDSDSKFIKLNHIYEGHRYDAFVEAYDSLIRDKAHSNVYKTLQSNFEVIDSSPFIYWISKEFRTKFNEKTIGRTLAVQRGAETGNNLRFLKFWWEVSLKGVNNNKGFFLYAKGGPYKKWFGNLWLTIDFRASSKEIIEKKGNLTSKNFYYKEGLTSVRSGSKGPTYRYLPENCVFDNGATSLFPKKFNNIWYSLGFMNSKIANYIVNCLNPTVNTQIFDIKRMPFVSPPTEVVERSITVLAKTNVAIYRGMNKYSLIELNFDCSPILSINSEERLIRRLTGFLNYENYLITHVLVNEAIIDKKIIDTFELSKHDKYMIEVSESRSIGSMPVLEMARQAYLAEKEATKEFPLDDIEEFIKSLPTKEFTEYEIEAIEAGFPTLYQSNNDLEEFCIRHQVNPINVWYWFKQSNIVPKQRAKTLAMEFLADMIREILMEDDDGIIPLVPNAAEKMLLDLVEEKFYAKGFTSAQYSSFDSLLGYSLNDYINRYFFEELSDHLNLFQYLPKTPFIWHLTSGPERSFDCYLIIYKWSRDNLMRLRSVYIENRERALVNRQSDLANNDSASAQTEKDLIFKQLKEIESFKKKIDELLEEGYNPILDDGVGKNIAPLQKKKMLAYDVLSAGQLKKYLNADW